jgi:hypothetical protein
VALSLALLALLAAPVLAQNEALVGSFRPYRHVLLAFGAAWVVIGAWVFRIGRKLDRVARLAEERSSQPDR